MSAGWYWVHPGNPGGKPRKVSAAQVESNLRVKAPHGLGFFRYEARQHMRDHKAGKSPAIGQPAGGFYQWEVA